MTTENIVEVSRQPVVLFVDDEKNCLDIGIKMLQRLGYTALAAQGGYEVIEIYKKHGEVVDLIIMDMSMPCCGELTYNKFRLVGKKAKILLTSGWCHEYRVKALLDQGCKGYIQKPFNIEVLSKHIENALRN